jgi:hypothetical protein
MRRRRLFLPRFVRDRYICRRTLWAADNPADPAKLTREALVIAVDPGKKGEQVVASMRRVAPIRSVPRTIRLSP